VDVFHQQHEMEFIGGRWFELWDQVVMEPSCLCGLGVHEQTATADLCAEIGGAGDDVSEQTSAQALAFVVDRDTEPGQQRDRLRITASSSAHSCRRGGHGDRGHGPCVVGDDSWTVRLGDHEHPRRARCVGLASVTSQPFRLFDRTALELLECVIGFE